MVSNITSPSLGTLNRVSSISLDESFRLLTATYMTRLAVRYTQLYHLCYNRDAQRCVSELTPGVGSHGHPT